MDGVEVGSKRMDRGDYIPLLRQVRSFSASTPLGARRCRGRWGQLVVVLASVGGGCRAGRRNHSVKRGGGQSQGGNKTTPQANVPNRNPAFELRAKRLEPDIRMVF